jgi:Flp pilus assembly protein TadD
MSLARCQVICSAGLLVSLFGCQCTTATSSPGRLCRDPAAAGQLNERGLALIEKEQLPEAEACFRQALQADPYYGPAHANLGVVLLQQHKLYEAGWELRYAAQLMPRAAAPRANLGVLYESVGRYGPAEENLRQALELMPDDVEVIGYLARLHVRQGKCASDTLAWLKTVSTQDDNPAWRGWAREQLIRHSSTATQQGDAP